MQARNRALEQEKAQLEQVAAELRAEQARLLALKAGLEAQLQAALLQLAELKRQLFGEQAEKLTPEEEGQLAEVTADLQEQIDRDPPVSDDVLEEAPAGDDHKQDPPKRKRRPRHPFPEHLERQTVVHRANSGTKLISLADGAQNRISFPRLSPKRSRPRPDPAGTA